MLAVQLLSLARLSVLAFLLKSSRSKGRTEERIELVFYFLLPYIYSLDVVTSY